MPGIEPSMPHSLLSPGVSSAGVDSPGSSVFDLPTGTQIRQPSGEHAPTASARPSRELVTEDLPSFIVISGGTGCNSICSAFGNACYVLPVSDDGGSSSEIIRVIGGPSIGRAEQCG